VAAIAVAWSIWGRGLRTENRSAGNGHIERNPIKGVLKNREVILLSIAEAGDMWSFQFLTSYLPTYYITEVGLSIKSASNITAVFPIAGIIAGLLCGFWMSKTGRRKPFTWPLHLVTFTGTLLAISGTGFIRLLGVSMAGFGNAGWAPALFTMPMEFENMTPARVGAVYTVVLSSGFLVAFISPWAGGWLGETIGLHDTIFLFSFSSIIAALCTFLMKETGPLAKNKSVTI
jgi:MFS family permease